MNIEFETMKNQITLWLDRVIQAKTALLYLAEPEDNHIGVALCSGGDQSDIHIYKGLEHMAFYLGVAVSYNPVWDEKKGEMSFMYKGFRIFQLWDKHIN